MFAIGRFSQLLSKHSNYEGDKKSTKAPSKYFKHLMLKIQNFQEIAVFFLLM